MSEPGIIVYFDIMDPLRRLSDGDRGRLFWAMLEYGRDGVEPDFTKNDLAITWEFIKPKLERNKAAYKNTVLQKRYAVACRERKRKGLEDISFEEWKELSDESASSVIG
ncbi:MAG: hypothetical protein IKU18_00100 [Bacteroidales bacterium]|nr:hypothetical protein [Bacteroidales bacterium]